MLRDFSDPTWWKEAIVIFKIKVVDHIRVGGGPPLIQVLMRMMFGMFGSRTWMWMRVGERHFKEQYFIVLLRESCVKTQAA